MKVRDGKEVEEKEKKTKGTTGTRKEERTGQIDYLEFYNW